VSSEPLFALFIRGKSEVAFEISDQLGFDQESKALSISIFEDGPGQMHIQALFETELQAENCLKAIDFPAPMESFITQLPDEDWVKLSQSGLPPIEAERFFLFGSHDKDKVPSDDHIAIEINAGQAFGTGHHGTTKGCLLILDKLLTCGVEPDSILDLGCGAGILAIAAAKSLQKTVLATDIDPVAIDVTLENAALNDVLPLISAFQADGLNSPHLDGRKFDLIFANILAGPLMDLASDIRQAVSQGGHIILSGILDEQAEKVADHFRQTGLKVTPQPSLSGWTSLLASA